MSTPFEMGREAGRKGKDIERGLMVLGLSFSADLETTRNTKEWLRGYDQGRKDLIQMTMAKQPQQGAGWSGRRI